MNKVNRIIWINNDLNLYDKFHIGKVKGKMNSDIKCNSTLALFEDDYKLNRNEILEDDSKEVSSLDI